MTSSDISFRVHRPTSNDTEIAALRSVGFVCLPLLAGDELDCYEDFGSYTDLFAFFTSDEAAAGQSGTSVIGAALKRVLNFLVRLGTKVVRSMPISAP